MLLFRDEYSSEEMWEVFREENLIAKWLKVDATVAECEAELGIIPAEAAREIIGRATSGEVKYQRVAELKRQKGLDIAAELSALAELCEHGAQEYIRMGVGGVDNYDTAWALLIKEGLDVIYRDLDELVEILVQLTKEHKSTLMVARTFGQHEGPITFGFKTAMWAKELYTCRYLLEEAEKFCLVGKVSGTIGNLSSLEKFWPGKGITLEKCVCQKLGLHAPDITILFTRRRFMDVVIKLSFIANAIGSIAEEIFNRQRPEIDELQEPFKKGQVSSTVSPHKRNPYSCNMLSGIAEAVRANVSMMLHSTWRDERDQTRMPIEFTAIPTTFMYVSAMIKKAKYLCGNLVVKKENMLRNLGKLKGLNHSEIVGTALALKGLGRYKAYDLMREIVNHVYESGEDFKETLKSHEIVSKYIDRKDIEELTDHHSILGTVEYQIETVLLEIEKGYDREY
jgi:adenylosuccinate lyase